LPAAAYEQGKFMIGLMSRFSVRANLIVIFALILCGVASIGLISLKKLNTLGAYSTDIVTNWLPSVEVIGRIVEHVESYRRLQAGMLIAPDEASRQALQAEAAANLEAAGKALRQYEPMITPGEERAIADDFTQKWNDYVARTAGLATGGNTSESIALFRNAKPLFDEVAKGILEDAQLNARNGEKVGDQALEAVQSGRFGIEVAFGLVAALCLAAGFLLIRGVSVPITGMTDVMRRLAAKDFTAQVPGLERGDEIGTMASAVQVFKDSMVTTDRLVAEQTAEHAAQTARAARVSSLVQAFEAKAGNLAQAVGQASSTMEKTAQSMSGTATRTNQLASTVAAATEEASAGVQTVASAAEELAASIGEISKQVAQSATITSRAVDETRRTDAIVRELSEGAQKIGQVVELIASIAGQTNLLALNATIEAARAGDAGKGFAVVASEVKGLAGQTARATEQIGAQVSQIQAATRDAVEAIKGIGNTISEVSGIATSIASAVEQQGAATAEIARNVQQTASATLEVTTNINGVSEAANTTGAAANEVLTAAGQLSTHADHLAREVVTFATDIRAA
jgi:methyl-accepting chemotaxis protein